MKVGDLVRLPDDNHYWWGSKVGLVIKLEPNRSNPKMSTLSIIVAAQNPEFNYVKFGANFVELVSEGG